MSEVKTIVAAIFCFIAAAETARGTVAVAPLSAAEYADTEVSAISVQMSPKGLKVVIE